MIVRWMSWVSLAMLGAFLLVFAHPVAGMSHKGENGKEQKHAKTVRAVIMEAGDTFATAHLRTDAKSRVHAAVQLKNGEPETSYDVFLCWGGEADEDCMTAQDPGTLKANQKGMGSGDFSRSVPSDGDEATISTRVVLLDADDNTFSSPSVDVPMKSSKKKSSQGPAHRG